MTSAVFCSKCFFPLRDNFLKFVFLHCFGFQTMGINFKSDVFGKSLWSMLWGKPETVFSYRLAKLYHKLSLRHPFVMSGIQPFQFLTIPTDISTKRRTLSGREWITYSRIIYYILHKICYVWTEKVLLWLHTSSILRDEVPPNRFKRSRSLFFI